MGYPYRQNRRIMRAFAVAGNTVIFSGSMTVSVFSGISGTKATGLAVLAGGVAESVFSPLFWIPAVLLFALFYAASQLRNNLLRVFLFWIPTVTAAVFCIAFVALYAYLFIRCQTSLRCAVQANELCLSGC
jgi:hypothetical protein